MEYQAFKEAVIARCQTLGIAEYELYYQATQSTSVSIYGHEVNQFTGSVEGGVCFRCIVEGKMGYASTEELSESQAQSIVERAVDNARSLETEDPVF
jgi:PmbA protein